MKNNQSGVFLLFFGSVVVSCGYLNGTGRGETFGQEAPGSEFPAAPASSQGQVLPSGSSFSVTPFTAVNEKTGQAEAGVQIQATVLASTAATLLSRVHNGADASERSSSFVDEVIANDPRGAGRMEVFDGVSLLPDLVEEQGGARPAGKENVKAEDRHGNESISSSASYNEADVVEEEEVPEGSNDGPEGSGVASRQVLDQKEEASLLEDGDVEIEEEEEDLDEPDGAVAEEKVANDALLSEEETLTESRENLGGNVKCEGLEDPSKQNMAAEQKKPESNSDALLDNDEAKDESLSRNSVQEVISQRQQDDTDFQEEESEHEEPQEVSDEDVTSGEQVSEQEEGAQLGFWKGRPVQTQLSSAQKKVVAEQQERFLRDFYTGNKRPGSSNSSGDGQLLEDNEEGAS